MSEQSEQTYPKLHTRKIIIVTAVILNLLFGNAAYHSTLDGKPVTIINWLFLMAAANIMCIIPICLIILLYCKIKNRSIERAEAKAQNTTQSKSSKVYFSNVSAKQHKTTIASKQPIKEATVPNSPPSINSAVQKSVSSNNAIKAVSKNTDVQKSLPLPNSEKEQISISLTPIVDIETQIESPTSVNSAHQELLKKYAIITPIDTTGFTDFDFFVAAGKLSIEHSSDHDKIKLFQRYLRIGFNYALRLCDKLCTYKVIKSKGSYFDVIMDLDSFLMLVDSFNGHMPDESAPSKTKASTNGSMPDFSNMNGYKFESWCAALLTINDFSNVTVTQGSGDHGADILAEKDDISYAFQCKYYSGTVGNKAVQEVYAAKTYYKRDIAVVMTNSTFTLQAQEEAAATHVKLWDKDKLLKFFQNCSSNK